MNRDMHHVAWPALEARTMLALCRVTGEEDYRAQARQQAFVLGLGAGHVDAVDLASAPLAMPGPLLAHEPELLDAWLEGVLEGRSIVLSGSAEGRECRCSNDPPDQCENHFEHGAHKQHARAELHEWLEAMRPHAHSQADAVYAEPVTGHI